MALQQYKFLVMFDNQVNSFYRGFQGLKAHFILCILKTNDVKITVQLHLGVLDLRQNSQGKFSAIV